MSILRALKSGQQIRTDNVSKTFQYDSKGNAKIQKHCKEMKNSLERCICRLGTAKQRIGEEEGWLRTPHRLTPCNPPQPPLLGGTGVTFLQEASDS